MVTVMPASLYQLYSLQFGFYHLQLAHAAHKLLRMRRLRLQHRQHVIDRKLRIYRLAASITVKRSETFLRIRVNGEMTLR